MDALAIPVPTQATAVKGPRQGDWTRPDWEQLPDDGNRYEIINGVLFMSPTPSFFHQWITQQFFIQVGQPAQQQGLAICVWAPIGVFMPGCDPVQPDFVVVLESNKTIIHDKRIFGVPDLLVEILSPSSADYDEQIKLNAYAKAGVPEYVVVDPAHRILRLYPLKAKGAYRDPQEFDSTQTVTFACLPTIPLQVGKLFEGAPDTTL